MCTSSPFLRPAVPSFCPVPHGSQAVSETALAARAIEKRRRVALLDLDPPGEPRWSVDAARRRNSKPFEVNAALEATELPISEGCHWVLVDTCPASIDLIEPGVAVSDLVVIPTRPSSFRADGALR